MDAEGINPALPLNHGNKLNKQCPVEAEIVSINDMHSTPSLSILLPCLAMCKGIEVRRINTQCNMPKFLILFFYRYSMANKWIKICATHD